MVAGQGPDRPGTPGRPQIPAPSQPHQTQQTQQTQPTRQAPSPWTEMWDWIRGRLVVAGRGLLLLGNALAGLVILAAVLTVLGVSVALAIKADAGAAGQAGSGPAVRRQGAERRAGWDHWHHGRAPLLRLRGDHSRAPVRLLVLRALQNL